MEVFTNQFAVFLGLCVILFVFGLAFLSGSRVDVWRQDVSSYSNSIKGDFEFVDPVAVGKAYAACSSLCFEQKKKWHPHSWNDGPCLSSNITFFYRKFQVEAAMEWGCDIAHCPRKPIDENKRNQCSKSHWIELDIDCMFLRFREGLDKDRQGVLCDAQGTTRKT
mmetsp:Transcript_13611/g.16878  ORF Transcript_13611/g.16878 Transcript_13611/m.16878 type:complete len:165 (+) Transcript_13611:527-1021(+)